MSRSFEKLPSWTNAEDVELHASLTLGSRTNLHQPGGVISVFTTISARDNWPGGDQRHHIGFLTWIDETIEFVQVLEEYRRTGIATQMRKYARSVCPKLKHSDDRTDDGDMFAASDDNGK